MASSVTAIELGFDYQAYLFWIEAGRLLYPNPPYREVGYEHTLHKSFDDIAVFRDSPELDSRGEDVHDDFYQVKFKVDYQANVTAASLTDPAFINATSASFLQKVHAGVQATKGTGRHPRFILVTPWNVDTDDILSSLIRTNENEIKLARFLEGTEKSAAGKVRKLWREHLGLKTDDELVEIVKTIRIRHGSSNFSNLQRILSDVLLSAGLEPIDPAKRTNAYPELIRRLHREGTTLFNATSIRQACEKENLVRSSSPLLQKFGRRLGVKSFSRFAENMRAETDAMISLLHHFDDRPIKDLKLWQSNIAPEIKKFLSQEKSDHLEFVLDTHLSCAFVAGYFLDPKAGVLVAVQQKTIAGRQLWKNESTTDDEKKPRVIAKGTVSVSSSGKDEAFAISITQPVYDDVCAYLKAHVPDVGLVHNLEIEGGARNTKIIDGGHATEIAMQIRNELKVRRAGMNKDARLHVLISAPVTIAFFLGRLLPPLGRIQLYEHNFDNSLPTTYVPSIELSDKI